MTPPRPPADDNALGARRATQPVARTMIAVGIVLIVAASLLAIFAL